MPKQTHEILIFEIGGIRIGLPAADVEELVRAVALTPFPGAPPFVEGLVNLRGRVIPVLDLRRRLQLPAKPVALSDHLIVARFGGGLAAVRVDRALELLPLEVAEVDASVGEGTAGARIPRVAKLPDGLALLHDLPSFFAEADPAALARALPAIEGGAP